MNDLHIDMCIIFKRQEGIVWHNLTIVDFKALTAANPHCIRAPAIARRPSTIHWVRHVAEERSTGEWLWKGLGAAPGLTFTLHTRRVDVDATTWSVNITSGYDVKEFWVDGNIRYFRTNQAIDDFWTLRFILASENE
jgi:hypothetical protein